MNTCPPNANPFNTQATIDTPLGKRNIHRLTTLAKQFPNVAKLPYSIRVLLEACLRNLDGFVITAEHVKALAEYDAKKVGEVEIPFMPGRVILQDFTGVPCVVDLAAMRSAIVRMKGDPKKVNPLVPCDLVIDHSVQVDAFGDSQAITVNGDLEFERNSERYRFLKWGQQALSNFRAVPPATGIVHQVNLEYLAKVVWDNGQTLYPDSLVGTDSHTTMINGLGVLGWGVGGIEAEAVMLGQPIYMLIPEVVGVKLTGQLPSGATATDLVLTITQMLRKHGVVGKFVEFFGPGLSQMPLADRATIANMAPEYGATCGFFPVDPQTIEYLKLSGRDEKLIAAVERFYQEQGLWRTDEAESQIVYSSTLELDLSQVVPSLAGPKRPQDRIALSDMQKVWQTELPAFLALPAKGSKENKPVTAQDIQRKVPVSLSGQSFDLPHGAVVIAAITSCTNTSNPQVMMAAGLVAKKAHELGLSRKPWVKTSMSPGSKVVTEYYRNADCWDALNALGFNLTGYGCMTCIGNSGPLPAEIEQAIGQGELVVASVLSGNRNFEGRVHPAVKANYLASPPLVVAYAIAGTVNIDLATQPLGIATQGPKSGQPIYLKDIWPSPSEVSQTVEKFVKRSDFVAQYADVFAGSSAWQAVESPKGELYRWDAASTYIQEPPFFVDMPERPSPIQPIRSACVLAKLGDSITTDHISPAGSIKKDSPAGKYLIEHGVPVSLFNSYGARRGNDRVMTRGTLANTRIRNQMALGTEGGFTTDLLDGQVKSIYDAAMHYREKSVPLVILAGKDYGMGSSRDWAAKGTFLLGVKAVIAESFERIHRSNLVGMGVLPLCFVDGQTHQSLGLTGQELFDIDVDDAIKPRQLLTVTATDRTTRQKKTFQAICRIDTPVEVEYYRNGGILQTVLRRMAQEG